MESFISICLYFQVARSAAIRYPVFFLFGLSLVFPGGWFSSADKCLSCTLYDSLLLQNASFSWSEKKIDIITIVGKTFEMILTGATLLMMH